MTAKVVSCGFSGVRGQQIELLLLALIISYHHPNIIAELFQLAYLFVVSHHVGND